MVRVCPGCHADDPAPLPENSIDLAHNRRGDAYVLKDILQNDGFRPPITDRQEMQVGSNHRGVGSGSRADMGIDSDVETLEGASKASEFLSERFRRTEVQHDRRGADFSNGFREVLESCVARVVQWNLPLLIVFCRDRSSSAVPRRIENLAAMGYGRPCERFGTRSVGDEP